MCFSILLSIQSPPMFFHLFIQRQGEVRAFFRFGQELRIEAITVGVG